MKFLKCMVAYIGRQHTAVGTYIDNAYITQSWCMCPGDYIRMRVYNYRGGGPISAISAANANNSWGDFFGRVNASNAASNAPYCYTQDMYDIACIDNNGDPALLIRKYGGDPVIPLVSVLHGSPKNRKNMLTSMRQAKRNNGSSYNFNYDPYSAPVPDHQFTNQYGIIRDRSLIYHKDNSTYAFNTDLYTGYFHYQLGLNQESARSYNWFTSMIDLEDKILHFLSTCGETRTSTSTGTPITSDNHIPTSFAYIRSQSPYNEIVWDGSMYATPPTGVISSGGTITTFCQDMLTLVSGTSGGNDKYGNCVDAHNNLCGWVIPQKRTFVGTDSYTYTDSKQPDYVVGRVGQHYGSNTVATFQTSFMELYLYTQNAQSTFNGQAFGSLEQLGFIPPLAIMSDKLAYNQHLLNRWGIQQTSSDVPTYPLACFDQSGGGYVGNDGVVATLRDIRDGATDYGNWGSYGILISTFETSTIPSAATQVYAPIHCLITPSLMSGWPAIDIYGISRQRFSGNTYYIQSSPVFEYRTKTKEDTSSPYTVSSGPAQGKVTLSSVVITKTCNMDYPSYALPIPPSI